MATPPVILSAHLSRIDDPELDGEDGLLVVLSTELDASSVQPRAFVVSRADAGPVWPTRAILAPASEDDENRSILLIGDFAEADDQHRPTHVAITGSIYAEDGARLKGLGAAVSDFSGPPGVVAYELLPVGPDRCEGAAQVLRTYWTDELRGVEPEDLTRVRVERAREQTEHPLRFDDHRSEHDEAGQDNVLDLCMAEAGPVRRVWMEAGAFRDAAGHASAAVQFEVDVAGS